MKALIHYTNMFFLEPLQIKEIFHVHGITAHRTKLTNTTCSQVAVMSLSPDL